MTQIIPTVLATSEEQYVKDLEKFKSCPEFDGNWLHIDFMDNKFVPNKSIEPNVVKKYSTPYKLEAHLMVEEPNIWFGALKDAGFKRIIAHIETEKEVLADFIGSCKASDIEVGIAIKMDTPLEKLQEYWEVIDLVLVMSIVPGFQGQPFIPESIERIKKIREECSKYAKLFIIGIDGHVNNENAREIKEAGVSHLIVGSYLLKGNIHENLQKIKNALKGTETSEKSTID